MIRKIIQIAVPFVWFGVVAAISFMEAPLKFQAPGITLPLGLGIGRLVFFALNKIEIALAVGFIVTLIGGSGIGRRSIWVFGSIVAILIFETVWLLPVLDVRAQQVIDGTAEPFSNMHIVYIFCDALKLVLLLTLGVLISRRHLASDA